MKGFRRRFIAGKRNQRKDSLSAADLNTAAAPYTLKALGMFQIYWYHSLIKDMAALVPSNAAPPGSLKSHPINLHRTKTLRIEHSSQNPPNTNPRSCGAWGYMETARAQWREEQQRQAALQRPPAYRRRVPHRRQPPSRLPRQPVAVARQRATDPSTPRAPAPARPDLPQQLAAFQAALPGSRGEVSLRSPHATRDEPGGRVVFPHMSAAARNYD